MDTQATSEGRSDEDPGMQPVPGPLQGVRRPALLETVEKIDTSEMRYRDPMRLLCGRINDIIGLVNALAERENERQEGE